MAAEDIERMVAEVREKAGDEVANKYRELTERIHACCLKSDFAGMRAVVQEAKQLLLDVEAKRQKQQQ